MAEDSAAGIQKPDGPVDYLVHVIAHLRIPAEARNRIGWAYYPAGHMTYVHEPSRRQQSQDLIEFVRSAR